MLRKIWKVVKFALLGLIALALTVVGGALGYRAYRQHQVAKDFPAPSPAGITDERFVKIGGIDQWIQIHGEDVHNPVLLMLHGGPGISFVSQRARFWKWEKFFTVVQWDQRGTGRTFGRNGAEGSGEMTIDRMVRDGIEVVEYLRGRLHQDKIILYGTSWGSILGATIAQRRPDLLYAYVGSGQVSDMARNQLMEYDALLRTVRQANDAQAIAALTAIGPPPYSSARRLDIEKGWQASYDPPAEKEFLNSLIKSVIFSPDYSISDILNFNKGGQFSRAALGKQMFSVDLHSLGTQFQVPVIIIQGADDALTSTSLAKEYYESLDAPRKEFVVIPNAGHLVFLAMPDRMLAEFLTHVRPLAPGSGS